MDIKQDSHTNNKTEHPYSHNWEGENLQGKNPRIHHENPKESFFNLKRHQISNNTRKKNHLYTLLKTLCNTSQFPQQLTGLFLPKHKNIIQNISEKAGTARNPSESEVEELFIVTNIKHI